VLDEYCQLYIGTASDIKNRIRKHWTNRKAFDRLLFPVNGITTSILSIDSFRAYDTTRIYIYKTSDIYDKEDDIINYFPKQYVCNRLAGGRLDNLFMKTSDIMKQRILTGDEPVT
jgi:hypothetical protein